MVSLCWFLVISTSLTQLNAAVNVERTVAQVQSILQQNSQLPRLTRDEILQLLEDIRAEDAKSTSNSQSQEHTTTFHPKENDFDNEINSQVNKSIEVKVNEKDINTKQADIQIDVKNNINLPTATPKQSTVFESTTKKNKAALMVVLPYTQSDGSSLQELYTRPPRVEVVPDFEQNKAKERKKLNNQKLKESLPNQKISEKLVTNAKIASSVPVELADLSAELREFLDSHGLKGNPGPEDHFLLPIEGFKPLPPARVVDGSVELPEKILLTYDLLSPSSDISGASNKDTLSALPPNNYLFEPLKPNFPFELDTSASNSKEIISPLNLRTKNNKSPNYEPIDYDSVKVIPLAKGPNPVTNRPVSEELENELKKRQTTNSSNSEASVSTNNVMNSNDRAPLPNTDNSNADTDTQTPATKTVNSPTVSAPSGSSVADSGASITDLEDSFGAPAPSQPGDSQLPPQRRNGFYWMLDWNSFLEVGDGDTKVNIRLEPKLGDPQMFLPVNVP